MTKGVTAIICQQNMSKQFQITTIERTLKPWSNLINASLIIDTDGDDFFDVF